MIWKSVWSKGLWSLELLGQACRVPEKLWQLQAERPLSKSLFSSQELRGHTKAR